MKNRKIIQKYYKTAFHKGKNAFARVTDFIAFRTIGFIVLYIWFMPTLKNPVLRVLLPLISMSVLSIAFRLFKSIRFERFCSREKERLRTKILCERFILLNPQELFDKVSQYTKSFPDRFPGNPKLFLLQKSAPVSADDVLKFYQEALNDGLDFFVLFHTSQISDEATEFVKKHEENCKALFICAKELALYLSYTVSDSEIDNLIIEDVTKLKEKKKKSLSDIFKEDSIKKYFTVSFLLFVASFFAGYPLYYRLASILASFFGLISLYFSKNKQST